MRFLLIQAIVLSVCTLAASAQPDRIIKQKAKDTAAGNNAQPGVPSISAPVNSSPTRPAPVAAKPNAQQQHVAKLKGDVAAIHHAGKVTESAKQEFAKDLLATVQGSIKPSSNSVATLANSLLSALAKQKVSSAADERLVQKLIVLMNSRSISSTRTQEITNEAQALLISVGVSADEAAQISSDLQAVAAEVQQGGSI